MPGENTTATRTRESLRGRLEADRQRLEALLTQTRLEVDTATQEADVRGGLADVGSAVTTRITAASIHQGGAQRAAEVEAALRRLDAGTYGLCAVCGDAIPLPRLDALPHVTTCVDHRTG
jgi:DnaK suppressor protein